MSRASAIELAWAILNVAKDSAGALAPEGARRFQVRPSRPNKLGGPNTPAGRNSGLLITHTVGLEKGPEMYKVFRDKQDSCVKVVLKPGMQQAGP